ncbi:B-cell CLL/lymphoma 9-like protein isoform X2 [Eleutherodactylus coqui]|uniref:B-cell CLL/lymphoma 9-like protein isoform X2 n=1 Tax=Eleutherodactylus coqui TaxID=57060 RepID=UPI003463805E
MHSESKLSNHGKTSSNGGQPQPANVSQGSKGTGLLGPKPNHMSPSGLKTTPSQGPNHGNGQREPAAQVAELKEPGPPSVDPEPKGELPPRSKRRCVLERKQPYSGDEWCSGPDSEEDEKSLLVARNCSVGDSAISAPTVPGSGSASLPGLNDSSSSSTTHGGGQSGAAEGGGSGLSSKAPSQYVYVFTTYLANTAAEAVLQGRADSILLYHQQNVPRAKLDEDTLQKPPSTPNTAGEDSVPPLPPSTSPAPANHPTGTPIPAPPNVLQTEAAVEEAKQELTPNTVGNNSRPASSHSIPPPASSHPNPPPAATAPLPVEDPELLESTQETAVTLNAQSLSREQLEHRERSLQTLRDIERLLLRSGVDSESFSRHDTSPVEGSVPSHPPPHVPSNPPTPVRKYEEPLQSMITQTQSLGGAGMEQEMGGPPSGPDMGHQMSLMMQRLGQDSLTPEQVAWRKLQEEYYAEKRRKEEHMTIHGRPAPDMMLRGPPPPYHNKPGEQWVGNRFPGSLESQEAMQLRGAGMTFQGPRFPGRYGLMQNIPMDNMGVMQRSGRWPEDMTPMGGGGQGSFPQSGMTYPGGGQGEVERFLNPPSRDEFLRQQLLEKRSPVMQRQLSVPGGQALDIERVIMQQRPGDPSMFQGDGLSSAPTLGMDFGGSRNMVSPTMGRPGPGRELESAAGGGGNLNMNMSVNMNMNLNLQMTPHQQMLLSQKMRNELIASQAGVGSEELARTTRMQNGSGMTGGGQKMVVQGQFPQGQTGFPQGQGPYNSMQQELSMEMFGPDHSSLGSTTRLSHFPVPSTTGSNPTGIGPVHMTTNRSLSHRSSELTVNVNQMESPIISRLTSPTLGQVSSLLVFSPSANLKSPQTQGGRLAVLLPSNPTVFIKSPLVLGSSLGGRSPSISPSRLKSPPMSLSSPGWAPSPKTALPSPGTQPGKQGIGMSSAASLEVIRQDGVPTQNPLSLMMSQMSKYAMPSSTPLYHNAIKTIATSDDELLPDRILLPPGSQQGPGMNPAISLHLNLSSSHSPVGNIGLQGQPPLSHEPPPSMVNSPGPPMHQSIGPIQTPLMIPSVTQDSCCPGSQMMSSNPLVFPPRLQPGPPHNPPLSQVGGNNSMQQNYPDETPNQPCLPPRISEPYGPGLPAMLTDPDLGDVIRPSPSGIPEFDLSRIMPSEKPSSTLQYFPKGSSQPPKPHPTNMHLLGLQNMMVEQHSGRSGPSLPGPQRTLGMPPMHPMGRTGMAPPSQTVQQNFMLMKQRSVSGEMYPQSSGMLSPQGALGGHLHAQQSMMVGHQLRQRSVSLDTYIPGPGHLPF